MSQLFKQPAPADGALLLFTDRPAFFACTGRLAITKPLALA